MMSVNFSGGTLFSSNLTSKASMGQTSVSQAMAMLPDGFVKVAKPLFGKEESASGGNGAAGGGKQVHPIWNGGMVVLAVLAAGVAGSVYLVVTHQDSSSSSPSPHASASNVKLVELGTFRGVTVKVPESMSAEDRKACQKKLASWTIPEGKEIKPGDKFTCSDGKGGKVNIEIVPHNQ